MVFQVVCHAISGEESASFPEAQPEWRAERIIDKLSRLRPLPPRHCYRLVFAGDIVEPATTLGELGAAPGEDEEPLCLQVVVDAVPGLLVVLGRSTAKDRRQWAEACAELGDGISGLEVLLRATSISVHAGRLFFVNGLQVYEADLQSAMCPLRRLLGRADSPQSGRLADARDIPLSYPKCLAFDPSLDDLYVADARGVRANGGKIYRISCRSGNIEVVHVPSLTDPSTIAFDEGCLYILDHGAVRTLNVGNGKCSELQLRPGSMGQATQLLAYRGLLFFADAIGQGPLQVLDVSTGALREVPGTCGRLSGIAVVRDIVILAGSRGLWALPLQLLLDWCGKKASSSEHASMEPLPLDSSDLIDLDVVISGVASDGQGLYIVNALDGVVLHTCLPDLEEVVRAGQA